MGKTNLIVEPGKYDFVITRVFDAPPAVVFKAWTDEQIVPQWMGPAQYTWPECVMDARPGGAWRWTQANSAGDTFGFRGVYHDVITPERIVQTFEFLGMPGHVSLETATFAPQGGKTLVTIHAVYQSVADRDGMIASGMEGGMNEGFDRLDAMLEAGNE